MTQTEVIIKSLEILMGSKDQVFNGQFAIDYMRNSSLNLDWSITAAITTNDTFTLRSEYMGINWNTEVNNIAARDEMYLDSILKEHIIKTAFNLFYSKGAK